jgi:hypothetical protein
MTEGLMPSPVSDLEGDLIAVLDALLCGIEGLERSAADADRAAEHGEAARDAAALFHRLGDDHRRAARELLRRVIAAPASGPPR